MKEPETPPRNRSLNRREFATAISAGAIGTSIRIPAQPQPAKPREVFLLANFHPASSGWLTTFSRERVYCVTSYLNQLDRVRDDPSYKFLLSEVNNFAIRVSHESPRIDFETELNDIPDYTVVVAEFPLAGDCPEALRCEAGHIELRMVECLGHSGTARIKLMLPHKQAILTDLIGREKSVLAKSDIYTVDLKPQQTATIHSATETTLLEAEAITEWDRFVPEQKLPALHKYNPSLVGHPPFGNASNTF
jgi:hypothetical protein